jgi:hypothetical protein
VDDVHQFAGTLRATVPATQIVIPLRRGGEIIGVLDIDSPIFNRFDEQDRIGLEETVQILESMLKSLLDGSQRSQALYNGAFVVFGHARRLNGYTWKTLKKLKNSKDRRLPGREIPGLLHR